MPSKEEIYSKLLFLMSAPAQRLVTVMNAVGRDLAVVINQGVEKNKFGGAADGGAAEAAPAVVEAAAPVERRNRSPGRSAGLGLCPTLSAKAGENGAPQGMVAAASGTQVWERESAS